MAGNKTVRIETEMQDSFTVSSNIRGHKIYIDQPSGAGGADKGPTPLEYFLFSLGGCIGTIGRIAALQQKINLRGFRIAIEGDYDPAGLLGKETDNRVGFQSIRVTAEIDADLTDAEKQKFLDDVCHRCPLHDNIQLETSVEHSLL